LRDTSIRAHAGDLAGTLDGVFPLALGAWEASAGLGGDVRSGSRHEARRTLVCLVGGAAGLTGSLLYSSFLIAGMVGSRLSPVDSFVSELEVPGQPFSGLFRLINVPCGLGLAVFAVALWYRLPRDRPATLGCAFLAASGLSGVLDTRYPMPCTPSTDRACQLGNVHAPILVQLHQPHALTGSFGLFAVVTAMLLLSVARGIRAWSPRLARGCLASSVLLSLLGLIELPLIYAGHGVGVAERVHVLLISTWIAALAGYLARDGLIGFLHARLPDGGTPIATGV
jgi:hypothetical protein